MQKCGVSLKVIIVFKWLIGYTKISAGQLSNLNSMHCLVLKLVFANFDGSGDLAPREGHRPKTSQIKNSNRQEAFKVTF